MAVNIHLKEVTYKIHFNPSYFSRESSMDIVLRVADIQGVSDKALDKSAFRSLSRSLQRNVISDMLTVQDRAALLVACKELRLTYSVESPARHEKLNKLFVCMQESVLRIESSGAPVNYTTVLRIFHALRENSDRNASRACLINWPMQAIAQDGHYEILDVVRARFKNFIIFRGLVEAGHTTYIRCLKESMHQEERIGALLGALLKDDLELVKEFIPGLAFEERFLYVPLNRCFKDETVYAAWAQKEIREPTQGEINKRYPIVRVILGMPGVDWNSYDIGRHMGKLFMLAVRQHDLLFCQELIDRRSLTEKDFERGLDLAVELGRIDLVELFLHKRGDRYREKTLTLAARHGQKGIIEALLQVRPSSPKERNLMIVAASEAGHLDIVAASDPSTMDSNYRSEAIIQAAAKGYALIVSMLVQTDLSRRTSLVPALGAAAEKSHLPVIKELLKYIDLESLNQEERGMVVFSFVKGLWHFRDDLASFEIMKQQIAKLLGSGNISNAWRQKALLEAISWVKDISVVNMLDFAKLSLEERYKFLHTDLGWYLERIFRGIFDKKKISEIVLALQNHLPEDRRKTPSWLEKERRF